MGIDDKIKAVGGRTNLYTYTIFKFIKNIDTKRKDISNKFKKNFYQKFYDFKKDLKETSEAIRELYPIYSDAIKTILIGFLPSKIQDQTAYNYLSKDLIKDEKIPGIIPTTFNIMLESVPMMSYFGESNIHPIISMPLLIDAMGRSYMLIKENKSSGIGEGLIKFPKIIVNSVDSLCLKYVASNLNQNNK